MVPARSLRNAVNRMADKRAALELALDAYEEVAGTEQDGAQAARDLGLRSPVHGLMFTLMRNNLGKLVTFQALARIQESNRLDPDPVVPRTTAVHICWMRRYLRGRYRIDNVKGRGYILRPWKEAP